MIAPGNPRRQRFFFPICLSLVLFPFLIGCTPSPEEIYESKLMEQENRKLVERIIELERQVEELQQQLDACQEDFSNLLYYNREKDVILKSLEEEVETLRRTSP